MELRTCWYVVCQICSSTETTIRQRAGESGEPIGLPRSCWTTRSPKRNARMSKAVVMMVGIWSMRSLRVTLRRRKVFPLTVSPGWLSLLRPTEKYWSSLTSICPSRSVLTSAMLEGSEEVRCWWRSRPNPGSIKRSWGPVGRSVGGEVTCTCHQEQSGWGIRLGSGCRGVRRGCWAWVGTGLRQSRR